MRRILTAVTVLLFGAAATALPIAAHAAGPGNVVTMTQVVHGPFTDDQATNPCTGDAMIANFDGTQVNHVTYFPASDEVWSTFTETGSVQATDNGVTYTGRATVWGNFNLNERNMNDTFTLTIHAQGSDGSVIIGHEVTHDTYNGNGDLITTFDKPTFTCG